MGSDQHVSACKVEGSQRGVYAYTHYDCKRSNVANTTAFSCSNFIASSLLIHGRIRSANLERNSLNICRQLRPYIRTKTGYSDGGRA